MQASIRIANDLTEYLRRLKRKGLAPGDWDERAAAAMLMGALFTDALGRDTMPERYPYSMRDAIEKYVQLPAHWPLARRGRRTAGRSRATRDLS
jgi:hypothetical protein